jgi:hypothetical protein
MLFFTIPRLFGMKNKILPLLFLFLLAFSIELAAQGRGGKVDLRLGHPHGIRLKVKNKGLKIKHRGHQKHQGRVRADLDFLMGKRSPQGHRGRKKVRIRY